MTISPPKSPAQSAAHAFYTRLNGNRLRSTVHTQGAWSDDEQHMAPVSGLLAEAIERCSARDDLLTSRITYDILGFIPGGDVDVTAQVIRPGRTIELVQAEMTAGGRVVVRATAWRLVISDTADVAGSAIATMPGPDAGLPWPGSEVWAGGYIDSVRFSVLPGAEPGRARVWLHTDVNLIDGESCSPLARYVGLVDTANGIATRVDPKKLLFPNTDLTIHLTRAPVGDWVGLDTTVSFGSGGIGLTSTVLHDISGPVGQAAQTLTLRNR